MPKVLIETRGAVTVLTLNRPDVHNCVDGETASLLTDAIDAFASDDAQHAMVITGAGDVSFCSGADLTNIQSLVEHPHIERSGPMGFARLDSGKPTIAAVNGYCFAGGFELACWCDMRIASENAEFGALNRRWGVPFTDGGTQRFARIVGQGNALYLIESGMRIDARRALAMGLVQELVPRGSALARALEIAQRVADYPQASLRADRAATLATFGLSLADGLRLEAEVTLPTANEPEMAAGLERFAVGDRPEAPRPAD
jgi:enoyl-CoA hydratase/carnithine racemase